MLRNKLELTYRLLALLCLSCIMFASCTSGFNREYSKTNAPAEIFPDYTDITIPVNIAPLNFRIINPADDYYVEVAYKDRLFSPRVRRGLVSFPIKRWRRMLKHAANDSLSITVYAKNGDNWVAFSSFSWHVSSDPIDPYLTFRLIDPGYAKWGEMGIYTRNITTFRNHTVLKNSLAEGNCMNCHSYNAGNPNEFMLHLRGKVAGTLITTPKGTQLYDTRTEHTLSAGVYPAWHPSGRFIAMSTNRIEQLFHSHHSKSIEVFDVASNIVVLDLERNTVITTPELSSWDRENTPAWSPKGDYLYFVRAPHLDDTTKAEDVRYDLLRIPFNPDNLSWGEVDTILQASAMGRSVSFPRASPCGRFILLTMSNYGYFAIHYSHANLYIYDLQDGTFHPLDGANSEFADSYHSWSSCGRWIAFASRRMDGVCSRPFFAHIDNEGKASKAFVLPMKNPDSWVYTTQSYNVPELSKGRIPFSTRELRSLAYQTPVPITIDPSVDVDALSGATEAMQGAEDPYSVGR